MFASQEEEETEQGKDVLLVAVYAVCCESDPLTCALTRSPWPRCIPTM